MKNSYIPEILKEKISKITYFLYATLLLTICILSAIALFSFSINDNSFLTSTSNTSQNALGNVGSYYASFLFYKILQIFSAIFLIVELKETTLQINDGRLFFSIKIL